jgi:hypothetical protein
MRLLLKPWFAVVVLLAAVAIWAFTIGPWGPAHGDRTAVVLHLALHGSTNERRTATSAVFRLSGSPAILRISAAPAPEASPTTVSLIADVGWDVVPMPSRMGASLSGDEGLMSPALTTRGIAITNEAGRSPRGSFRMRISALSDVPATITATVSEPGGRGYLFGVPVLWIIIAAGVAYIGLTVVLLRRQYPPNPPFARLRHEFE